MADLDSYGVVRTHRVGGRALTTPGEPGGGEQSRCGAPVDANCDTFRRSSVPCPGRSALVLGNQDGDRPLGRGPVHGRLLALQRPRDCGVEPDLWTALSPPSNLFTPQQKLFTRTRVGAKVTKTYDTAKTPYQRLLEHPDALDETDNQLLAKRFAATNPAQSRRGVSDLHTGLLGMVAHKNIARRGEQNAAYLSRATLDDSTTQPRRAS